MVGGTLLLTAAVGLASRMRTATTAGTTIAAADTVAMVLLLSQRAAAVAVATPCSSRIRGIAVPRGGRAAAAIDGVANGRWRPSLCGRIGARDANQVVGIMREEPLHLVEVTQGVLDATGQLVFLAWIHLDGGPEDGMSSRLSSAQTRAKCAGLPLPLSKGITLQARSELAGHCGQTRAPQCSLMLTKQSAAGNFSWMSTISLGENN